jgi:hypothetical protein
MANFGDFKGVFNTIISYLKSIDRSLRCLSCGGDAAVATSGVSGSSIPAGLSSFALVKTSASGDTVDILLSDGSTYSLTEQGEVFADSASNGGKLPAYTISGAGTYKWHGLN